MIIDSFIEPIDIAIKHLPKGILTLLVGYVAIKVVVWLLSKTLRIARVHRSLISILESLSTAVLWVILVAAIFSALGLNQIAFAISGSVAIIGLGLATGTNALVQDIISGLFLAKDPDFNVGTEIKVGDVQGVIERIDIRKIRIRTTDNKKVIIANSIFDKTNWQVILKDKK